MIHEGIGDNPYFPPMTQLELKKENAVNTTSFLELDLHFGQQIPYKII